VTLVYEVPGLVLTMRGKALESGAEGDTINILNMHRSARSRARFPVPARSRSRRRGRA